MTTAMLSEERVRRLYEIFRAEEGWEGWLDSYREEVVHFQNLTDEQFRQPEQQRRLWSQNKLASIGPGNAVTTEPLYNDTNSIEALVQLRQKKWPEDHHKRAESLQLEYDRLLELVHGRLLEHQAQAKKPQAKLGRLFATFFPRFLHTTFPWKSNRQLSELLLGVRSYERYESSVLVKARLSSILGAGDLDEQIHLSMFCWWLVSHYETISEGRDPIPEPQQGPVSVEIEQLVLWHFKKQRKGLTAVSGYVETYRAAVEAARNGATREDIAETMRANLKDSDFRVSPSQCRDVFNVVRTLGFLEHQGGLWSPSEEGQQLIEEDPPDILVEKLLIRVYGLAQVLRVLKRQGPLGSKSLYTELQQLYPNWKTQFAPSTLAKWAESLGLLEHTAQGLRCLSEYGGAWEARLPEELPKVDNTELSPEFADPGIASRRLESPELAQLLQAFKADSAVSAFVFSDSQIQTLHVAWHCHPTKRFVILSGLSGTGKTAILLHYARIYAELLGLPSNEHLAVIPVSPDWRDPSGLLGYFNALHADATFQAEPALRLILAAAQNPDKPYFLILDEMNLARVELYFAPFLSAMETGQDLLLHAHEEPVNDVPPSIMWPRNLFIGGTVNMDETTHPFSDKVLDRAFTMEFWDVNLQDYFERRAENGKPRHTEVEDLLLKINGILYQIRRHFGYRTANECLAFLDAAKSSGALTDEHVRQFVDQAVFSKILPRLRGEENEALRGVFDQLGQLCQTHSMKNCKTKLTAMQERLENYGVTRFWS